MKAGHALAPLAVSAIVGAGLLASRAAGAADTYAAIAFSNVNGFSGYGHRYPSRQQAEERALIECGESCAVVMWVRNECAVLYVGKGNGYGASRAVNEDAAVADAERQCQAHTTACRLRLMTCSAY